MALVPDAANAALDDLAAACVRAFDRFRAPLSAKDRARRAPQRLSPRQREYLDQWGYPFVFEEFRFHMTLTGRLPPGEAEVVRDALAAAHRDACGTRSVAVATLALFVQSAPGTNFRILTSWPLRAA